MASAVMGLGLMGQAVNKQFLKSLLLYILGEVSSIEDSTQNVGFPDLASKKFMMPTSPRKPIHWMAVARKKERENSNKKKMLCDDLGSYLVYI
jgi:hypothetical protein